MYFFFFLLSSLRLDQGRIINLGGNVPRKNGVLVLMPRTPAYEYMLSITRITAKRYTSVNKIKLTKAYITG